MDNTRIELIAAGSCGSNGTAVVARGCAFARTGTGVYTVTLDKLLGAADALCFVTPRTTGDIAASLVHTTDTVKTVNMRSIIATPAAADCAFDVAIFRLANGTGR